MILLLNFKAFIVIFIGFPSVSLNSGYLTPHLYVFVFWILFIYEQPCSTQVLFFKRSKWMYIWYISYSNSYLSASHHIYNDTQLEYWKLEDMYTCIAKVLKTHRYIHMYISTIRNSKTHTYVKLKHWKLIDTYPRTAWMFHTRRHMYTQSSSLFIHYNYLPIFSLLCEASLLSYCGHQYNQSMATSYCGCFSSK